MRFYFITFRSVTFAQRAERLLQRHGIRAGLMRTPGWMEEQGCGYALKLRTGELQQAVKLLHDSSIRLRKVYAQLEDGELEEVRL